MNREIKFRAWTGISMEYNVVAGVAGAFYALIDPNDSAGLSPTSKYYSGTPIMQSTGLKDRNGKEIYEGDIFKSREYKWGPVEFANGSFFVNLIGARQFYIHELFEEYGLAPEVGGNIFENPGLRK